MHALDLGLSRHLFNFSLDLAHEHGVLFLLNERLRTLPRFPGLRVSGLLDTLILEWPCKIALQAFEYRELLRILCVVLVGLFPLEAEQLERELIHCVQVYLNFYANLVSEEPHSTSSLDTLETLAQNVASSWSTTLKDQSASKLNFIKFHVIVHAASQLRRWGNHHVFSAEAGEG